MFLFFKSAVVKMAMSTTELVTSLRVSRRYKFLMRAQRDRLKLECNIAINHKNSELSTMRKESVLLKEQIKNMENAYYKNKIQTKQIKHLMGDLDLWVEKITLTKIELYSGFKNIKDKVDKAYIDMKKSGPEHREQLTKMQNKNL